MTDKATIIRIWDFWIRSFHWLLAASVGFMLLSGETGFMFVDWHRKVGEFVLALLLFRILWGVFGSSNARLGSLLQHPRHAVTHLRELARGQSHSVRGHNAAGGWAVVILLLLLSFQAITGLFIADEDEFVEGAFYGSLSSDLGERLLHLHHTVADLLKIVVAVHVIMVFVYLLRAGQNLITPMFTGRMQWKNVSTPPGVRFTGNIIGCLLMVACLGIIGLLLGWFQV